MTPVDLFLGGDIGLWLLERITPEHVRRVFTFDLEIAEAATRCRLDVLLDNANRVQFKPSATGFSIHYPRILFPPLLERYHKVFNLHPGYLPWGRGYYPIFWAIWEQSPAGATLHEISPGIDEGPIVAQQLVKQFPHDTGGSLFTRVREAEKELFDTFWPKIIAGENLPTTPQSSGGSYHSKKDFYDIKRNWEWRKYDNDDLIRLIRALSFPGFTGLEVTLNGYPFEIRLNNIAAEQSNMEGAG